MLKVERNLARNSLESYERDLLQYHDFLESELNIKSILNVTLGHIRSYLRTMNDKGLAANSVKRAVSSIRTYHNFLSAEGLMVDNPAQLLDAPKIPQKLPKGFSKTRDILLPDECVAESFQEGERVWAARENAPAKIVREYTKEYQDSMAGIQTFDYEKFSCQEQHLRFLELPF